MNFQTLRLCGSGCNDMALNIHLFVQAVFFRGFTGLTLLLQNIFQTFMGIAVPYTLINVLLNSIPVFIGLKFIGKKFTISSVCVIVLSGLLTDIIPSQPITYDTLLIILILSNYRWKPI